MAFMFSKLIIISYSSFVSVNCSVFVCFPSASPERMAGPYMLFTSKYHSSCFQRLAVSFWLPVSINPGHGNFSSLPLRHDTHIYLFSFLIQSTGTEKSWCGKVVYDFSQHTEKPSSTKKNIIFASLIFCYPPSLALCCSLWGKASRG